MRPKSTFAALACALTLGGLYALGDLGRVGAQEPLLKRSLEIREKTLGAEHPDVATSLEALGWLYSKQGKAAQAEPLLKRATAIYEKDLGADHPHVARCCTKMAQCCRAMGRNDEAKSLDDRARAIHEKHGHGQAPK
jgi:hypothetical protein